MQSRASINSLSDELATGSGGVVKNGSTGGKAPVKEIWPSMLFKVFGLVLALGTGVLVGVVASLHLLGVFSTGMLSSRVDGAGASPQQLHLHLLDTHATLGLNHGMTDSELLWRASMVPARAGLPIKRTPKVAFMFLTVGPLPLAPLWELFFKGHKVFYNIYVHSLPGYEPKEYPSSVFFGRHVSSQEVKWGDISMNDAERRLLANALLDFDNERFVLLSESCAPIWNFTFTYNYLMNSNQSFVGVFDDPGPFGRGRYNPRMAPEVAVEQWRKGAQWFEVSRELAIYIVSDVKYYQKFRQFCQDTCYVDEHYIPTMMYIEFKDKIAGRSVTAVDWSKGGSHPGIFGKNLAQEFLHRIRSDQSCTYNGSPGHVCYLFARKFRPDSLQPLLRNAQLRRMLR
ncbi:glycosyltransferase BC10 [Physcomitrium patens]|uniref:Uncharacterized protein n=1 Tax=Physcomitrium patens TaxID=3218 RepID=A0A2K1JV05_PHYPA|nr:uncharacterized protein LOC112288429 [Physcomitrium patens]PNR45364.1 hypothetical protein PHYPA_015135 [Physcomitrium patens]|eukprot:XP_024388351.1 uncharacterized protein LOC112288429 [Physcomitrella patens]